MIKKYLFLLLFINIFIDVCIADNLNKTITASVAVIPECVVSSIKGLNWEEIFVAPADKGSQWKSFGASWSANGVLGNNDTYNDDLGVYVKCVGGTTTVTATIIEYDRYLIHVEAEGTPKDNEKIEMKYFGFVNDQWPNNYPQVQVLDVSDKEVGFKIAGSVYVPGDAMIGEYTGNVKVSLDFN